MVEACSFGLDRGSAVGADLPRRSVNSFRSATFLGTVWCHPSQLVLQLVPDRLHQRVCRVGGAVLRSVSDEFAAYSCYRPRYLVMSTLTRRSAHAGSQ